MNDHERNPDRGDDNRQVDKQQNPSTKPKGKGHAARLESASRLAKAAYRRAVTDRSSVRKEARVVGCSPAWIGRLIDPDDDACPSLAHIFASSREVQEAMALQMAAIGDAREESTKHLARVRAELDALQRLLGG